MKYDAFISYRHSELDMFVAKKVHKYLETFKVPRKVQKLTGKKKINRVFRDQEELPIGSDLGDNIGNAIRESEYLLVICSPRILQSEWCMKEIDTFIEVHDRQHVLAILVEGEPNEAFPPQLLVDEFGNHVEPLAADVRGASKKEVIQKIKTEGLRLCAAILGCDYDDLKQRHRERILKRYTFIAAGIAVLALAFGFYNAYNLNLINENYQAKLENESKNLAARSLDVLKTGDRKTAALIAMEGLPIDEDRPLVPEAEYALSRALNTYCIGEAVSHDKLLSHDITVDEFYVCRDGEHLISYDNVGTLYKWDVAMGNRIFTIASQYNEGKIVKILDVAELDNQVIAARESSWTKYDEQGNEILSVAFDGNQCYDAEFSDDANLLACNFLNNVNVYDTQTGKLLYRFDNEDPENRFSGDLEFSDDSNYLVVEHSIALDEKNMLTYFDLQNQRAVDVEFEGNLLFDMKFTADGYLLFSDAVSDSFFISEKTPMNVEKVDLATGERVWVSQVEYVPLTTVDMTYPQVSSRIYTDDLGQEHAEAFASTGSCLYTLDLNTGEEITNIQDPRGLECFAISTISDIGFMGSWDGKVDICNFTSGAVYTNAQIDAADSLIKFKIVNGRLFVRSYLSNDITVMTYQSGVGMEELPEIADGIDFARMTPGNDSFVIGSHDDDYIKSCYIFDSKSAELTGEFMSSKPSYEEPVFVDDTHVAFLYKDGTIGIVDTKNGKEEEIPVVETNFLSYAATSANGDGISRYVAYFENRQYHIVDLNNGKIIGEGPVNELVDEATISPNGSYIFYSDYNRNLYKIDVVAGTEEIFGLENGVNYFTVSNNGEYLAAACSDGQLRIYDVETGDIICEKEFFSLSSTDFIQFSTDDTMLYLQGGDYYFRIFDIASAQYVYTYTDKLTTIQQVDYCESKGILTVRTWYELLILDCKNYGLMSEAEYGLLYVDRGNKIVSGQQSKSYLYSFPYQDYDELIAEAWEQFGKDASLTEEQKLKYNIY